MATRLQAVRKAMKKSTMFYTSSKLAKAPNITISPAEAMRNAVITLVLGVMNRMFASP